MTAILTISRRRRVTNEYPTRKNLGPWAGRVVAILIVAFIGLVVTLMFMAVRGPR